MKHEWPFSQLYFNVIIIIIIICRQDLEFQAMRFHPEPISLITRNATTVMTTWRGI